MKTILNLTIIIYCILLCTCNNDTFSPIGNFQNKIVVNCIIDCRSTIQFAMVQHTFLSSPDSSSKIDKTVNNVDVKMSDGASTFLFKDTIIQGLQNYKTYYIKDFNPIRGSQYSLTAESPNYPISQSFITIPAQEYIGISYGSDNIGVLLGSNRYAKGYLHHMYVNYDILENARASNITVEIPLLIVQNNDGSGQDIFIYPSLSRESSINYPQSNLIYCLATIKWNRVDQKIKIKKAYVVVYSFDENLYNYYLSIQGFSDPYSIRLDQPFFTNIKEGYGVFGAITSDSNTFKIPPEIIQALEFIDGQQ